MKLSHNSIYLKYILFKFKIYFSILFGKKINFLHKYCFLANIIKFLINFIKLLFNFIKLFINFLFFFYFS